MGVLYPFFSHPEFDKMQIPPGTRNDNISDFVRLVWRLSEFAFLCGNSGCRTFYFIIFKEVIIMYDNIGGKIKALAIVTFAIEAFVAIITGLVLVADDNHIGWLVIFAGAGIAWIGSWLTYGFGELIEKTCNIEKVLSSKTPTNPNHQKETRVVTNNSFASTDSQLPNLSVNETSSTNIHQIQNNSRSVNESEIQWRLRILDIQHASGEITNREYQNQRKQLINSK